MCLNFHKQFGLIEAIRVVCTFSSRDFSLSCSDMFRYPAFSWNGYLFIFVLYVCNSFWLSCWLIALHQNSILYFCLCLQLVLSQNVALLGTSMDAWRSQDAIWGSRGTKCRYINKKRSCMIDHINGWGPMVFENFSFSKILGDLFFIILLTNSEIKSFS